MNADISLKSFDIVLDVVKDREKAIEFVSKIEETIEVKFDKEKDNFELKKDLSEMETRLNKSIYFAGLIQYLAIVGSVIG